MTNNIKIFFLIVTVGVLIWSGLEPKDTFVWALEVFPSFIGLPLLVYIDKKWGVGVWLFIIFCVHSMILSFGGHYTYSEVPLGFWFQDLFHFSRNHYDRLGHLFQGITPALIAFDYFKGAKIVNSSVWLKIISICIALSFSASYEIFEWWTAISTGDTGTAFLGTQGDPWDTQWDMFMALCGSSISMLLKTFKNMN